MQNKTVGDIISKLPHLSFILPQARNIPTQHLAHLVLAALHIAPARHLNTVIEGEGEAEEALLALLNPFSGGYERNLLLLNEHPVADVGPEDIKQRLHAAGDVCLAPLLAAQAADDEVDVELEHLEARRERGADRAALRRRRQGGRRRQRLRVESRRRADGERLVAVVAERGQYSVGRPVGGGREEVREEACALRRDGGRGR